MRKTAVPLSVFGLVILHFLGPSASHAQGARVRVGKQTPVAKFERANRDQEDEGQDSDADDPQGRQEWFRSGRRAAGERASDLLHRAYVQKQQMTLSPQGANQQSNSAFSNAPGQSTANGIPFNGTTYPGPWTNLGPAPIASDSGQDYGKVVGRVTSVVVDQGDTSGNTIYIGAAFGGVWKSTNAAASDPTTVQWTPLIDDQPTLAVGAVSVQPGTTGNSAVVLVGTGEPNSSGDSYYGMGILRSNSGGAQGSWTLIKSADTGAKTFAGLGASKFAWSAANPNLVVVGMGSTNGKRYGSDSIGGRGIYYSQDAGQTWHYATVQDSGATLTEGTVTDVAYNPGTGRFYAFYRYHGFYESADGVTWTRSANQPGSSGALNTTNCPTSQPTNPNPTGNCPLYRGHIAIQPVTHDMYVIYVNDSDIHQGVFVTSNGATTPWREITSKNTAGLVDTDQAPASSNQIVQGDYNLWLSAIATSQGTDLLIGTRNIYKCSLTGAPADCTTTWKNLTHVYDCSPIAQPSHVHPDQHGFDFNLSNRLQMYFVNDGGVYRSLNGANGDGTCNVQQVFDNLDANIGSLSEMVSFSQHTTNPNVLLGGLQDNGSPALLGGAPGLWQTVNGGDGGFNEIDPTNPDGIWYATNTGVSIQQCDATNKQASPNGPNIPNAEGCTPGTFGLPPYPASTSNVGRPQVANDTAEFYMPYILEPADGALGSNRDLLVGTCRLWRGPGFGGDSWFNVTSATQVADKDISPIFDSNATSCANGTTKIRAIAAGGPQLSVSQKDGGTTGNPTVVSHTVSKVLYVGLEGAGTVSDSGGNLGHVFVNTNAGALQHGSTGGWTDVTANIAATLVTSGGTYGPYPISSIQVDQNGDPSGQTAYVTVEGFGVSHVFRTTNAGQTWSDVTSNLPDAPVDSIAIDPDNPNVLYVGTDIGAFISLNAGASWQIIGTGLPNVPVTKIRVFGSNGAQPKLLRVSTYGRGVWQFALPLPPAFDVSPSPIAFGNQLVKTSSNRTVVVTNNSGAAISIASIALGTPTGTDFSIASNNCPATLANLAICQVQVGFAPQNPGQQNNSLLVSDNAAGGPHTVSLSGTGSDFAIAVGASGSTVTVNSGQAATFNLNATSLGGFNGSVTFTCTSGVPSGASCSFAPSATVTVSATTAVTLNISTTAHSNSQPAPISGSLNSPFGNYVPQVGLTISFGAALTLLLTGWHRGRRRTRSFAIFSVLAGVALIPACGGGTSATTPPPTNTGTPAGTYTVVVTATSGSRSMTTTLTLKVN